MNDFERQVLKLVAGIPLGQVATYGQLAKILGYPNYARQVGRILSQSSSHGSFPCHRVVNSSGRLAPHWEEQKELLWAEGVEVKANGCVDLKRYRWKSSEGNF
ncbi:methylated-DNA--protein-cysteine methyltransferase [Streptococcus sp. DD10]|uniref:MGMT family protein n=1 Tax=Streptococcus sp. DD10 TaxID=1777878 RepID=UPI00079A6FEA|nr:MGMT family protein [Streptococcus sp. DD10]KXT73989.1 methylated-DNA--protein-cysteine methyltransferase [Streptococcus sp. DD10]